MSIERESRLVLNRLMKDNEKSLINEVLNFIRCKYCKYLMDECCCARCDGLCGNRLFEGCDCSSYCEGCEKKFEELASVKMCEDINGCYNMYDFCESCIDNKHIHNKLGIGECKECGDKYCGDCNYRCRGGTYCGSCHEDKVLWLDHESSCGCDECLSYDEYKAGQIW